LNFLPVNVQGGLDEALPAVVNMKELCGVWNRDVDGIPLD